ncbi:peroxidase superfamily protein [Artemisia annua]|uniref:peroxidase n=1 Tax=Artemisia annua TaxID=35608 RepID=A0A2U1NHH9_ARTAN|nr:peroxidase superfamily protein [Artemisia annua]
MASSKIISFALVASVLCLMSITSSGGPAWRIKLGRRDSRTASLSAANIGVIPSPSSTLSNLINRFHAQGLSVKDLVALSGAHTIGQARCTTFRARVHNDSNIDTSFTRSRQSNCPLPTGLGDNNLAPLDVKSPAYFDNSYFRNLISEKGLLRSDQQLRSGGATDFFVEQYSRNPERFYEDFTAAMIKMGDISPLTGRNGEIRKNCRVVNS